MDQIIGYASGIMVLFLFYGPYRWFRQDVLWLELQKVETDLALIVSDADLAKNQYVIDLRAFTVDAFRQFRSYSIVSMLLVILFRGLYSAIRYRDGRRVLRVSRRQLDVADLEDLPSELQSRLKKLATRAVMSVLWYLIHVSIVGEFLLRVVKCMIAAYPYLVRAIAAVFNSNLSSLFSTPVQGTVRFVQNVKAAIVDTLQQGTTQMFSKCH